MNPTVTIAHVLNLCATLRELAERERRAIKAEKWKKVENLLERRKTVLGKLEEAKAGLFGDSAAEEALAAGPEALRAILRDIALSEQRNAVLLAEKVGALRRSSPATSGVTC